VYGTVCCHHNVVGSLRLCPREIEIPLAPSRERADEVSVPFRDYYLTLSVARGKLRHYLDESKAHHFFISGAEQLLDEDEPVIEPDDIDGAAATG
jgi:hypothetical protein